MSLFIATVGLTLASASLVPAGRRLPTPSLPAAGPGPIGLGAYPTPLLTLIQATASMVAR